MLWYKVFNKKKRIYNSQGISSSCHSTYLCSEECIIPINFRLCSEAIVWNFFQIHIEYQLLRTCYSAKLYFFPSGMQQTFHHRIPCKNRFRVNIIRSKLKSTCLCNNSRNCTVLHCNQRRPFRNNNFTSVCDNIFIPFCVFPSAIVRSLWHSRKNSGCCRHSRLRNIKIFPLIGKGSPHCSCKCFYKSHNKLLSKLPFS